LRVIFSSIPVGLLVRRDMGENVQLRRSRPGPVPLEPLYILFENYNRAQCEAWPTIVARKLFQYSTP
jgi:hypothetical protein